MTPKNSSPKTSVVVSKDVRNALKSVAAGRGETLFDYLNELLLGHLRATVPTRRQNAKSEGQGAQQVPR